MTGQPRPAALLTSAILALRSGNYEAARGHLLACLISQPDDAHALRHLALLQGETGDLPGARASLQRLIRLRPDDDDGWQRLVRISRAMDQPDSGSLARRALALMPDNPESWRNLALMAHQQSSSDSGNRKLAPAAFRRARLCGADASVAVLESLAWEQAGDQAAALLTLEGVLRAEPQGAEPQGAEPTAPLILRYARLLYHNGRAADAWPWACRALALRPAHADSLALIIALLNRKGDDASMRHHQKWYGNLLS